MRPSISSCLVALAHITCSFCKDGINDGKSNGITSIEYGGHFQGGQLNDEEKYLDLLDMRVPMDNVYEALADSPVIIESRGQMNENYVDMLDVDGWGQWSIWSRCSNTCGVGLSERRRKCMKRTFDEFQIACEGKDLESMVCNKEACSEETSDFRQHQCSVHNDKKMFGLRKFTWDAYYGQNVPPCVITCIARKYNFLHSFGLALDGTSCGLDRRSVCFGGQCRFVGCDGVLDSQLTFDACGVCGGDNSTCYRFQKLVDGFEDNTRVNEYEYNNITVIPAGATTVSIRDYTKNYIVLTEMDGDYEKYVINGNSIISSPGIFDIAGSIMKYSKVGVDETVEFDGPTTRDIRVLLFYFGDKPLTIYEYWMPLQMQPTNKEMITEFKIIREIDAMERLRLAGIDINVVSPPTESSTLPSTTSLITTTVQDVLPTTFAASPTTSTAPTSMKKRISYCRCRGHLNRRSKFCSSDFVLQVTVLYKQRLLGKFIRFAVEISSIFKSKFPLMKREFVWFPNVCCSRLRSNRRYLLMGRKVRHEVKNTAKNATQRRRVFTRLVVDNVDYWYPWRKTYQRRLKKFAKKVNCKKYSYGKRDKGR